MKLTPKLRKFLQLHMHLWPEVKLHKAVKRLADLNPHKQDFYNLCAIYWQQAGQVSRAQAEALTDTEILIDLRKAGLLYWTKSPKHSNLRIPPLERALQYKLEVALKNAPEELFLIAKIDPKKYRTQPRRNQYATSTQPRRNQDATKTQPRDPVIARELETNNTNTNTNTTTNGPTGPGGQKKSSFPKHPRPTELLQFVYTNFDVPPHRKKWLEKEVNNALAELIHQQQMHGNIKRPLNYAATILARQMNLQPKNAIL